MQTKRLEAAPDAATLAATRTWALEEPPWLDAPAISPVPLSTRSAM